MSPRSKAVTANLVWAVAALVLAASVAGLLAGVLVGSVQSILWLLVPLSLVVIGPLAAVAYTSVSWRLRHRPVRYNVMPVVVALLQGGVLYALAYRLVSGDPEVVADLSKGGLVLVLLVAGTVLSAIAGAVAILFLVDAEFPES